MTARKITRFSMTQQFLTSSQQNPPQHFQSTFFTPKRNFFSPSHTQQQQTLISLRAVRQGLNKRFLPNYDSISKGNYFSDTQRCEYSLNRNPKYATISKEDIHYFKSVLGSSGVLSASDGEDLSGYNEDWMGKYTGKSTVVLRPKTTEQISSIMKYCNEKRIAIVPQGGNTGLVGGSVPVFDEVIISTSLMNKIVSFDDVSGTLICQSGCILERLGEFLDERGYMMPLDLSPKGSCQIGGNVASAAGGLRFLRYRSLHANVLGLEVVLPNGTILNNLKSVRKDNTGYHMDHLFIGSEGTLGIITSVSLQVPVRPQATNVVLLGLQSFESVQKLYLIARQKLGEILSAFEFFDKDCYDLVVKHTCNLSNPLQDVYPFYILLETQGSNGEHDQAKLNEFFEDILGRNYAVDGTLAFDSGKAQELWTLREAISECLRKEGLVIYKYDISLPIKKMYELVQIMRERLKTYENTKVYGFGHIGDDNLHLNITSPKGNDVIQHIEPFVYEWTSKCQGSISAEHGIGLMKSNYLSFSKQKEAIEMMMKMKQLFDPNSILQPYKLFTKQ